MSAFDERLRNAVRGAVYREDHVSSDMNGTRVIVLDGGRWEAASVAAVIEERARVALTRLLREFYALGIERAAARMMDQAASQRAMVHVATNDLEHRLACLACHVGDQFAWLADKIGEEAKRVRDGR